MFITIVYNYLQNKYNSINKGKENYVNSSVVKRWLWLTRPFSFGAQGGWPFCTQVALVHLVGLVTKHIF